MPKEGFAERNHFGTSRRASDIAPVAQLANTWILKITPPPGYLYHYYNNTL
jgi:hypothetical protein